MAENSEAMQKSEKQRTTPNKLTLEDRAMLLAIRKDREELIKKLAAITNQALADKWGVDITTIQNLFAGKTYKSPH